MMKEKFKVWIKLACKKIELGWNIWNICIAQKENDCWRHSKTMYFEAVKEIWTKNPPYCPSKSLSHL